MVEIVNLRVSAVCDLARPRLVELASGGSLAEALTDRHPVWFDEGPVPTPVYDRAKLAAGVKIDGPRHPDPVGRHHRHPARRKRRR